MSPRAVSGGPKYAASGDGSADEGDPRWVVSLKSLTGASSVSSERLDVAKCVFILLVCAGHLCEPFYKIQNKPTQAFMHVIYGFHVPAFVLISGYVSGDLNAKRRRALIGGIVAPFLILHVLFSVSYTKMFCEGEKFDAFEADPGSVADGRPRCELVNHWALLDKDHGAWDGWDRWTFAYPFAQLWYLVSLFTKRIWRPFALEMRWTLLLHVVLGLAIGYTTIGRFLSLHRSTVHMPYFLCGYLMKKHKCFFPEAKTVFAKTLTVGGLVVVLGAALVATYKYNLRVEYWFQSDPHDAVYGEYWAYGCLFQLALYAWTFFSMAVAFALIPGPRAVGVRYPGEEDDGETAGLLMGSGSLSANVVKNKSTRRVGRYGRERDQTSFKARVYLRLAKWGSRTLYPFVLHIAVFMLLAKYTDWYEITWHKAGGNWEVTARFLLTLLISVATVVLLSLKPTVGAFRWLLEPSVGALYSPEMQKC
jgi:fucose 4-O-acetylase-like acetyltransferase